MITEQNLIDLEFEHGSAQKAAGSQNLQCYYLQISNIILKAELGKTTGQESWYVFVDTWNQGLVVTNLIDLIDWINIIRRITGESSI